MSEAKADVNRNPVSPVVTSPDASKHPDESRHVTSPAICRMCDGHGEIYFTPYSLEVILSDIEPVWTSKPCPACTRPETLVSPTDGETPPPAR